MVTDFIRLIFLYFEMLWEAITHALRLNPEVLQVVEQYPWSAWVVAGIVFLAGASTLLGQSAVLFINRVRKSRFVISLVTNGLIFIISYIVWGFLVWLVGYFLFDANPPIGQFVRMVGLSTAPLVFSFFVLIPWMGPFIGKVLNVWSLVILIGIVQYTYKIEFWGAVLCVGLGWLVSLGLTNFLGKPVTALRNKVFRKVAGSSLDLTAEDILVHFSGSEAPSAPQGGTK